MKVHPREMVVYSNPSTSVSKKTLAYAKSISTNVREIDALKERYTARMWRQILNMLELQPKDLLDKSHSYYQEHIRGRDFDEEGWLHILSINPHLIKAPIVFHNNKAILCANPTDIYRLLKTADDMQAEVISNPTP